MFRLAASVYCTELFSVVVIRYTVIASKLLSRNPF